MKNVCFFNSVKFWGGGEKLHLEYALGFRKNNYKVFISGSKNSELLKRAELENLNLFDIEIGNLSFLNPFKLIKFIQFLKREKIDTIIFSISTDSKFAGIAAKLAGINRIVYLRGLAAPISNSLINRILFKYFLTHIVANSEETKKMILKNLHQKNLADKIKVVYHGIDLQVPNIIAKNKFILENSSGIVLANAGRLTPQKGHDYLLQIAKELKDADVDFTLFIAGIGELKYHLETKIKELQLEKEVYLMGFVEDMESFMSAIDIFLSTSVWEGFGYVLVEAMKHSKPCIAFDISSNPEIIKANETGYLIPFPDVTEFANKIKLLASDENLRKKMGENARLDALKRFKINERIDEFISVIY
ncbi:MAG: glycosyltransferase [Saprospiraceae bacterium]